MLTRMDRAKLAMHGIWNYEQFYLAYMEADALLRRPPFPQLEDLHPKHQIAYELYNKIPEKVTDSTPWGPDHTGAPS
ncbi:hypothetical protein H0H93_007710 [Arthromyces matolae]|nr:hypothetical protein H0H93_007710 [Arthromyces matolae]